MFTGTGGTVSIGGQVLDVSSWEVVPGRPPVLGYVLCDSTAWPRRPVLVWGATVHLPEGPREPWRVGLDAEADCPGGLRHWCRVLLAARGPPVLHFFAPVESAQPRPPDFVRLGFRPGVVERGGLGPSDLGEMARWEEKLLAEPLDPAVRLVYADWLAERDFAGREVEARAEAQQIIRAEADRDRIHGGTWQAALIGDPAERDAEVRRLRTRRRLSSARGRATRPGSAG